MTPVMDDPDEIAAALRGTALDGHPVEEGIGNTFLITGVVPEQLLDAWRAARSALPETGRWPILTGPGELCHEPTAEEVAALAHAARTLDPWSVYRRWHDDEPISEEALDRHLTSSLNVDLGPLARRELTLPTTRTAIERWIWELLLTDPALAERGHRIAASFVGTRTWYTPREVQLVLLPTSTQWLAPAWISYFGATRPQGTEGLAAAIRQWERQWGAELVACWSTMLQFVVTRQPEPGEQAWQLAKQLLAVGGNLQMAPWQLALAVTRSDAWFLHDRP
ncbi:DUF4253 domain-containing protein [Micromonospora sp. NPDC047074]|uniref:DUF4253 domain-containing protein n=1 Tax=Micromonospora sp. NPDC047074 TaxID=3154339 RepID=UPI0033F36255